MVRGWGALQLTVKAATRAGLLREMGTRWFSNGHSVVLVSELCFVVGLLFGYCAYVA